MKPIVNGELFRIIHYLEPDILKDNQDTGSDQVDKTIKHYQKKECND